MRPSLPRTCGRRAGRLSDVHDKGQAAAREHEKAVQELQRALDEAKVERDKATDARHRLEERLGTLPGRAYYLQNLLKRRIALLEGDLAGRQLTMRVAASNARSASYAAYRSTSRKYC